MDARGQGEVHAGFAFVAHRAVVDVDVELGIARVAQLACAQDVGRAINPLALEGQLEGGSLQGLGLAVMEELLVEDGVVVNRAFGEYRIPTIVDAPALPSVILELGHPDAPYGVTGVGEMASITSTPAVLAALRAATGRELTRAPVRPEDLAGVKGSRRERPRDDRRRLARGARGGLHRPDPGQPLREPAPEPPRRAALQARHAAPGARALRPVRRRRSRPAAP